ncbi:hypothetical protein EFP95_11180 [Lentilactobacillus hilgardii]|nr:hypothetical protein [Lentilactobacillus hilgardii]
MIRKPLKSSIIKLNHYILPIRPAWTLIIHVGLIYYPHHDEMPDALLCMKKKWLGHKSKKHYFLKKSREISAFCKLISRDFHFGVGTL